MDSPPSRPSSLFTFDRYPHQIALPCHFSTFLL
nr:MAG TPA: hypothetical protein [Caudoviricetes sp.]